MDFHFLFNAGVFFSFFHLIKQEQEILICIDMK